jgi:hypothetical protein
MVEEIKELGEEKWDYISSNHLFKFGDIIENGLASLDNPRRFGIIIKARRYSIHCTDGNSDYWDLIFNPNSRIKKHGNALNDNYEKIKNSRNEPGGVQKP